MPSLGQAMPLHAAIRLLALLGVTTQGLLSYTYRNELAALGRGYTGGLGPEVGLLFLAPAILGLGGAAAARTLHRRGSRWAWVVVVVPLAILLLGYSTVLYLTVYPPPMPGGSEGLPL